MIDRIQTAYERSTFDFRSIACPTDPLRHLFNDWVPYYRMKAAIAEVLRPASILEIGVRYGYSAAAFLHGSPGAAFTGIDLDSTSFGGELGAIDWARRILSTDRHTLLYGNSQEMQKFPGGVYDLIHIDGQQDGDGTFHDLSVALRQARVILLDGYLWSRNNFQAANEFLHQHRLAIHSWSVIPGYAGELIIQIRPDLPERSSATNREYYLRDLAGAAHYADALAGKPSPHQQITLSLALAAQPATVVDAGCGRGELARAAAERGCRVWAVDRSATAIELTSALARATPSPVGSVAPVQADIRHYQPPEPVDCIVAADVLLQLSDSEQDEFFASAARSLRSSGRLVVRASRSTWHRQQHYRATRRQMAAAGVYFPPEDLTFHERLLGVRALSAARLRRQLQRYFSGVLVWLGRPENVAAGLGKLSRRELVTQSDIFAIAANTPIEREAFAAAFRAWCVNPADDPVLRLRIIHVPIATAGQPSLLMVELHNGSSTWLTSEAPCPLHLSYHLARESGEPILFEGLRTPLSPPLAPGARGIYPLRFLAPSAPGVYKIDVTLVQEAVRWLPVHVDAAFTVT